MRLYVGNLSFNTTQNQLEEAFGRFGTVTDAMVMTDRQTSQSRGFGFVTMSSPAEGSAAISGLHDKDLGGREITVNEARPREDRGAGAPRSSEGRPERSGLRARRF